MGDHGRGLPDLWHPRFYLDRREDGLATPGYVELCHLVEEHLSQLVDFLLFHAYQVGCHEDGEVEESLATREVCLGSPQNLCSVEDCHLCMLGRRSHRGVGARAIGHEPMVEEVP